MSLVSATVSIVAFSAMSAIEFGAIAVPAGAVTSKPSRRVARAMSFARMAGLVGAWSTARAPAVFQTPPSHESAPMTDTALTSVRLSL